MTQADHPPLQIVEDLDAVSGDAEAGDLAEHREHVIMNRRLDEDLV
jgi:hypothetical protein